MLLCYLIMTAVAVLTLRTRTPAMGTILPTDVIIYYNDGKSPREVQIPKWHPHELVVLVHMYYPHRHNYLPLKIMHVIILCNPRRINKSAVVLALPSFHYVYLVAVHLQMP